MTTSAYRRKAVEGNGRPVFVDGVRSAFVKSFGSFEDFDTLRLFSAVVDGLLKRVAVDPGELSEMIVGAVIPQTKNPNLARDTVLNLNLPTHIHGYTLNRACTSSMQTASDAVRSIAFGNPALILAGGVECLSDVPIVYSKPARKFLIKLSKAKSLTERLTLISGFDAKAWLPKAPELAEPLTGLTMGQHTEIMAKLNDISRDDQDQFALNSHIKAAKAEKQGFLAQEIVPIWAGANFDQCIEKDNLIRPDTTLEMLAKLRPAFDRKFGSLTAGNSSPLTDGASVGLFGDEKRVLELGLKPKLQILDVLFVGVDPAEQLLIGPAIAIPKLLEKHNLAISDIDRFEIHEAFAAQVLSCIRSMNSKTFCEKYFGWSSALGEIPEDKVNVNGGAIAIGHPFGATGTRLLTSISNELIRSDKELGLIAICAAGGMAGAMLVKRYR
jgi:acetyl-CoA acetyltransferase family protein